jgi:hypothetical protein
MLTLKVNNQSNNFNFVANCFYLKGNVFLRKKWGKHVFSVLNEFSQQEFATFAN